MIDAIRGWTLRFRRLLGRGEVERELQEELEHHIELETAEGVRRGLSPAAARREALRGFGGLDRFGEEAREVRGGMLLEQTLRDLRYALRQLRKTPQFTLAVVLTLALGIGANTAIFSVVDAVLLGGSPFAEPDRLVMVWETDRASETYHEPASWPDVLDMRERSRTLSAIGSFAGLATTVMAGPDGPERASGLGVTPNLPALLGVTPVLGRLFDAREAAAANPAGGPTGYALLGEEYWRRRFAADPGVLGRTISVNERPTVIVGVLPADADLGLQQVHAKADYAASFNGHVDLWLSIDPGPSPRETHPYLTIGRLAAGASLSAAQEELGAVMAELERTHTENRARGVNLEPYAEVTFGPVRPALVTLLVAVGLVLLVACVNVANLLLVRTQARAREIAVRLALGASLGRIARQFLAESLLLTLCGAAAGVALAWLGLEVLVSVAPSDIPRLDQAAVNPRALGATAALAVVVSLGFGMLPVLHARRIGIQSVLKAQPGRRVSEGRDGRRFRAGLVVAEVALAVMLVVGAGLLLRSFWALSRVDPGFHTEQVLKVEYELPSARYPLDFSRWPDLPAISNLHEELRRRVAGLPGVEAATLAARHPLDAGFTNSFVIVGREAEAADWPEIRTRMIAADYLETMGVPLLAGRAPAEGDVAGSPAVAVVNRSAVERYFASRDPLGQQIRFWGVSWRIVGVIGDERFNGVARAVEPAVYVPLAQAPQQRAALLVRGSADPLQLIAAVRHELQQLDPQLAPFGMETLEQTLAGTVARPRFIAVLLTLFGALAVTLAMIGVHGVLSYVAAQRAPEVGIRMALGANRTDVVRLVVGEGAALAALGTLLGLLAASAGSRLLASLVFGISTRDAATYVAVGGGVLLLASLASLLPARRAAAAEPAGTLRAD